jgi:O-antigen/teichoic acid export membrane protein
MTYTSQPVVGDGRDAQPDPAPPTAGAIDAVDETPDDMPGDGRDESRAERYDRNLSELLQELRVAGIGVQVLFGFLLSLPFTNRFTLLDHDERRLYAGTLVAAALAVALLVAPVAYHRLVFRRHQKGRLLRFAQWTAVLGLACTAVTIGGAFTLVMMVVLDGVAVPLVVGGLVAAYALLWLVIPLHARRGRDGSDGPFVDQ